MRKKYLDRIGELPYKLLAVFFIISILLLGYFQISNTIDGWVHGEGSYYVNIFPEDSESKNYRVVADVDYDNERYEYNLIRIKFENGGYLTFDNDFGISPLRFYQKVLVKDDDDNYWYAELTKEKVKIEE